MFVLFGVAAGSVTIGGLAGIVGFIVARRTREIAIRIAIGAERRHVRRLVVRQTLVAAALGLAVGLLTGRWASAGLESLLYGIEAGNWTTPMAAAGLMLAITVAAALVPARRAARRDAILRQAGERDRSWPKSWFTRFPGTAQHRMAGWPRADSSRD